MPSAENDVVKVDGSLSFEGGVDSLAVRTIQSQRNPNGVQRNQLCWLVNATVRDGGITQRWGWKKLCNVPHVLNPGGGSTPNTYQGGIVYQPVQGFGFPPNSGGFPICLDPTLILSVGGHLLAINVTNNVGAVFDLSTAFSVYHPDDPAVPHAYFVQGEQFLVKQAGDGVSLPLIFDNYSLRVSKGITTTTPTVAPGINEIPAAYAMDYYMGRLWYAQGQFYSAGDIVAGPSGSAPYHRTDSILSVTEAPLVFGGDGFAVGSNHGLITTLFHTAELDAAIGQGNLYIGTPKAIYRLQVPVSRTDWIATTSNNQPLQTIVQLANGPLSDRSVVIVNGDAFYRAEDGIRSLAMALRYFKEWGNTPLSTNEARVIDQEPKGSIQIGPNQFMPALGLSSGVLFDNRLLQTALPNGLDFQGIIPLDFAPISDFNKTLQPSWEGLFEGLNILQLIAGEFNGQTRAFAVVDKGFQNYEVWELTQDQKFEQGDTRVQWVAEFPAFTWGDEMQLKELVGAELWIDELVGEVIFKVEYRPDGSNCWNLWHEWVDCFARNSAEAGQYPGQNFQPGWRSTITLHKPTASCNSADQRPTTQGYQFQVRVTVTGYCRIRGLLLMAVERARKTYQNLAC